MLVGCFLLTFASVMTTQSSCGCSGWGMISSSRTHFTWRSLNWQIYPLLDTGSCSTETHSLNKHETSSYHVKISSYKLQTVLFNMRHPSVGINSLTLSVSLIHILDIHLLTTLHTSDPHSRHHLCHHQSLLLFFTLDLKHTSSSDLFHRGVHHTYSLDWSHGLLAGPFSFAHRFCFSF